MKTLHGCPCALVSIAALQALAGSALGQCAHGWADGLAAPGVSVGSVIRGMAVYDDGTGPAMYITGLVTSAGGVANNHIAKWSGSNWSQPGTGLAGTSGLGPRVMAVYNGELYVGGNFTTAGGVPVSRIARWNGTGWAAVDTGLSGAVSPDVISMRVFNDGSGAALYVGGVFDTAGGVSVSNIARWNGTAWSALAGGPGPDGAVNALEVFNDGSGAVLYAGGAFANAGGAPAVRVARWSGGAWSAAGAGLTGSHVDTLVAHNDGAGAALYAGGLFTASGATAISNVARWNAGTQAWGAVGGGANGQVWALASFDDDGPGPHAPALYAGGAFSQAGGQPIAGVARWNGAAWSSTGSGTTATVAALAPWNDPRGPALYAAGLFGTSATFAGLDANSVARFDGAGGGSWTTLGAGMDNTVNALAAFDDGTGFAMFATGPFTSAGGVPANRIAKRSGGTWSPIGPGATNGLGAAGKALAAFTSGGAHDLYVGGDFTTAGGLTANHIAKWDGTSWTPVGSGVAGTGATVNALAVYDDGTGPAVFVGGAFSTAGGQPASNIVKWDPATLAWVPLGAGTGAAVNALCVFDEDGPGPMRPALFVGGAFTTAGGATANRIAKWDGSAWTPLTVGANNGFNGPVDAMTVFNDGSGPALYLGGGFNTGAGVNANRVARWNGSAVTSLGTGAANGVSNTVSTLAVYDEGTGQALFVGGLFTTAGGVTVNRVARWTGSWSAVGGAGLSGAVNAMAPFSADPAGAALWLGGAFDSADGKPSGSIARWTIVGPAAVITQQPQSHTAWTTQPTMMTVAATGSSLAYQWRLGGVPLVNGGRLAGVTSPVLLVSPAQLSDSGSYDVVISGCNGTTVSSPALLNVVCYPNCDASSLSPVLNVNDFICFQNRFAQGDPYANCDGSTAAPVLNVNDFICFQSQFAGGCH